MITIGGSYQNNMPFQVAKVLTKVIEEGANGITYQNHTAKQITNIVYEGGS